MHQSLFHSVVYFSDSLTRAELLSELLYFDGIQLEVISDSRFLSPVLRQNDPKLILYDHEEFRSETAKLIGQAREICGPELLIVPLVTSELLTRLQIDELLIDSTLDPCCDFEAIHCTIRRLLSPKYQRGARREERLPLESDLPFSVETREGIIDLKPSNLNMSGAQLELSSSQMHYFRPDQLITLNAKFPKTASEKAEPILIRAITRWVSNHTLGVEFYDFNRIALKNLIDVTKKN